MSWPRAPVQPAVATVGLLQSVSCIRCELGGCGPVSEGSVGSPYCEGRRLTENLIETVKSDFAKMFPGMPLMQSQAPPAGGGPPSTASGVMPWLAVNSGSDEACRPETAQCMASRY